MVEKLNQIALIATEPTTELRDISQKSGWILNPTHPEDFEFQLFQTQEMWKLKTSKWGELVIDFENNHLDYQRRKISANDPLPRALGLGKACRKILDLTAGMAMDAVYLSQLNCEVTALERNSVIYFLLSEAQKKCMRPDVKKIQFLHQDAVNYLNKLNGAIFDAIYFDPMYPEKKKSALPRKEMQIFRHLVGTDLDTEAVFLKAALSMTHRLVVKRPLSAAVLPLPPGRTQTYFIEGKTVRYQVLLRGV